MAKCDFFKFQGIPIWSSPGWAHSRGEGVVNLHSHTQSRRMSCVCVCGLSDGQHAAGGQPALHSQMVDKQHGCTAPSHMQVTSSCVH